MAVATVKTVIDGHTFNIGDTLPDMGSLVCKSRVGGTLDYEGLDADKTKLPHWDELETGSSFFAIDTLKLYKYEKTTDTWIGK